MINTYIPTTFTRILALDPTTQGLAYAVLEKEPMRLIDWGVKNFRSSQSSNSDSLELVDDILRRYGPDILVLENYKDEWRRTRATKDLTDRIAVAAGKRRIKVCRYSRKDIQETFVEMDASSKEEIAEAIAAIFPELTPRLPQRRKIWMAEDYRMNIFDAAALALTAIKEDL